MRGTGSSILRGVLAMAGPRSPWGKGSGDKPQDADGEATGGAPQAGDSPPEPPAQGPRNPWLPGGGEAPRRSAGIEDIFKVRKPGGGGNGGGGFPSLPQRPGGKSWLPVIGGGLAALWLLSTSMHQLGSTEQGIVTTLGSYSRTIGSGVSMTLPWPIESVKVADVTSIQRESIPEGDGEKLMLTSDQNLVDLSYLVRWNIKDLKLYTFQLENPTETVREVAEAAMRASIAEVPLQGAMGGAGRATVEQNVRDRMQEILDGYRSGVLIQGVEIKKADPPDPVKPAFEKVTAAQQDAQKEISNYQARAQQLTAQAQAAAASFDLVYEQYRLAPEVTRRRMYYETMERVLSNNEKVVVEGAGVTSYLPLPEIKRRAPEPATTTGGQ